MNRMADMELFLNFVLDLIALVACIFPIVPGNGITKPFRTNIADKLASPARLYRQRGSPNTSYAKNRQLKSGSNQVERRRFCKRKPKVAWRIQGQNYLQRSRLERRRGGFFPLAESKKCKAFLLIIQPRVIPKKVYQSWMLSISKIQQYYQ